MRDMAFPVKPPVDGNPANNLLWRDWLRQREAHRWIHAGYNYKSGTWGNLNGSLNLLFVAGGGLEPNLFHKMACEGAIQVQVYVNPTIGVGSLGTAISVFNNKFSSENVNQGSLYANPGIADIGTRIPYGIITGGTNVGNTAMGGSDDHEEELIFSVDQEVIFSLATESALDYEYQISWYEEE